MEKLREKGVANRTLWGEVAPEKGLRIRIARFAQFALTSSHGVGRARVHGLRGEREHRATAEDEDCVPPRATRAEGVRDDRHRLEQDAQLAQGARNTQKIIRRAQPSPLCALDRASGRVVRPDEAE